MYSYKALELNDDVFLCLFATFAKCFDVQRFFVSCNFKSRFTFDLDSGGGFFFPLVPSFYHFFPLKLFPLYALGDRTNIEARPADMQSIKQI